MQRSSLGFTVWLFTIACTPTVETNTPDGVDFGQASDESDAGSCDGDGCETVAGATKWHPGHYAMSDTRPTTPGYQDLIHSEMDEMAAVQVDGESKMRGFEVNYTWYWLETEPGVYNTSLIDQNIAHLAELSAQYGTTFRLIIQINDASPGMVSFQDASQEEPYRSADQTYRGTLPSYIHEGVSGLGSDVFTDLHQSESQTYYHPALWREGLMTRFIALQRHLGDKYDGNPYVEAIIPVGETSWALNDPPGDLTDENWTREIKRLIDAVHDAWPTTNKIFNSTWAPTGISQAALLEVTQYQVAKSAGFGGPDILYPEVMGYEVNGAQTLRGAGGEYGDIDYRGTVPSAWQEQANYSNWVDESAQDIEAYCYDTLAATHVIWANHHDYGRPEHNWETGVVATLNAVGFRIHADCPTSYAAAGCGD